MIFHAGITIHFGAEIDAADLEEAQAGLERFEQQIREAYRLPKSADVEIEIS